MMNFSFSKGYLAQLLTEEIVVCVEISKTPPQLGLCKPFQLHVTRWKKMLDHCFYFNEDNMQQHKKIKWHCLQANEVPSNFGHRQKVEEWKNALFLDKYSTLLSVCATWLTPLTGSVFFQHWPAANMDHKWKISMFTGENVVTSQHIKLVWLWTEWIQIWESVQWDS